MLNKSHYIAFGAILGIVLVLLNLPEPTAIRAKVALGSLFLPLFGLVGSGQSLLEEGQATLVSRRTLLGEIERLRRDNSQLDNSASILLRKDST